MATPQSQNPDTQAASPDLQQQQPQQPSSQEALTQTNHKVDITQSELQAEFKKFQEANQKAGKKMDSAENTFLLKMALKLNKVDAKANSKAYDVLPVEQKRELDKTMNQLKTILQSEAEAKPAEVKQEKKDAAFTPLSQKDLAKVVENSELPSNATEKTNGIMESLKAMGYKLGIKDEKLFVTRIVEAEGKPFVIEPISFKISADTDIDVALQKFLDEAKARSKPAAQPQTPVEVAPAPAVDTVKPAPAPAANTPKPAEVKQTIESATNTPKPVAETKETTPTGEIITKHTIGLSPEEIKMVEGIQAKGYEIRREGKGDNAVVKLYIGNKIEGESHGEIKPALESFAYQVKDKPSVKTTVSFSEIGDKISGVFKGIFGKKEEKQKAALGVETQPQTKENIPDFAKDATLEERALIVDLQNKGFEVRQEGKDESKKITLYRGGKLVEEVNSALVGTKVALKILQDKVPYILNPKLKEQEEKAARDTADKQATEKRERESGYPSLDSLIAIEGDATFAKALKVSPEEQTAIEKAGGKNIKLTQIDGRAGKYNLVDAAGKEIGKLELGGMGNSNLVKEIVKVLENYSKQEKTPAGRGFTLDDIQSDSGKPKPKFTQQPNQQDPNVNVGRIQVEGREASANQTLVKPKPNLGKVDISDIPAGGVINPKTGKIEI